MNLTKFVKETIPGMIGAMTGLSLYFGHGFVISHGYMEAGMATQLGHILYGLGFLIIGNMLPKRIPPLPDISLSSPRVQTLRRFAGWTLALGGLSYSITWLAAPVQIAETLGTSIALICVLVVVPPAIWLALTRNRDRQL